MKTLLYGNRSEPKSISVISILLLAAAGDITKLRCMHRECYIFASQNLCLYCVNKIYISENNNPILTIFSEFILYYVIHMKAFQIYL